MTAVRSLTLCTAALLVLLGSFARQARAQPENDPDPHGAGGGAGSSRARTLHVEARASFGPASLCPGGWGEALIRIANTGLAKASGEVLVNASGSGTGASFAANDSSRAPFAVAEGATVSIRIPIRVAEHDEPLVRVLDGDGRKIHHQSLQRATGYEALLVDVSRASALGAALRGMPVPARNDPYGSPYSSRSYGGSSSVSLTLAVASPPHDASTGDPVLPQRTAAYSQVAAMLLRTDDLTRIPAAELEALTGYLLAGGTLALVVARPEDLRHPVLVALVGQEVTAGPPHEATHEELILQSSGAGSGSWGSPSDKKLPRAARAEPSLADQLAGYVGGNLQPSLYGSSAAYGLGEIHLLAFDPTRKPGVDSAWAQLRMVDLVRRATERRSGTLRFPGGYHNPSEQIRRELDPNEGSRWAIVLAALLLCVYSVVAGPVNFAFWRRRGKPLRALIYLPVLAGATFGAVVVTGIAAKGCRGQARHLTVVEAGAGMHLGSARRWRGFFVPSARKLTVRTTHASAVVSTARMDMGDVSHDKLLVDRDGARLFELALRPWQTVVIREDGLAALGEGITLLETSPWEVTVGNDTGRRLRGLLLHLPGAPTLRWLDQLEPGATAPSKTFSALPGGLSRRTTTGGLSFADFDAYAVRDELERVSTGLGSAWEAVSSTTMGDSSWFPSGVPTLLTQLDGGEGTTSDSGLDLDSDRVLVRVVGFGGRP